MLAFLFKGGSEDGRVMFFKSKAPKLVGFLLPQRRVAQYILVKEPPVKSMDRYAGLYELDIETALPDCPAGRKLDGMNRKQADAN